MVDYRPLIDRLPSLLEGVDRGDELYNDLVAATVAYRTAAVRLGEARTRRDPRLLTFSEQESGALNALEGKAREVNAVLDASSRIPTATKDLQAFALTLVCRLYEERRR